MLFGSFSFLSNSYNLKDIKREMVMIPVLSGKTNQSDDVALNVQTKPDTIFNPGQGMMKIKKRQNHSPTLSLYSISRPSFYYNLYSVSTYTKKHLLAILWQKKTNSFLFYLINFIHPYNIYATHIHQTEKKLKALLIRFLSTFFLSRAVRTKKRINCTLDYHFLCDYYTLLWGDFFLLKIILVYFFCS